MISFMIGLLLGALFSTAIFVIKNQLPIRSRNQQESIHRLLARERRNRFDVRSMR